MHMQLAEENSPQDAERMLSYGTRLPQGRLNGHTSSRQIQLWNHIRDSQDEYGMTSAVRIG
jgi:hypothetical protein